MQNSESSPPPPEVIHSERLQDGEWLQEAFQVYQPKPLSKKPLLIGLFVGLVIISVLVYFNHLIIAGIALLISMSTLIGSFAIPGFHQKLVNFLARFTEIVGTTLGWVLLTPIFYLGILPARLFQRLAGADPLRLRQQDRPSFWLWADDPSRKAKRISRMFATEPVASGGRKWLLILFLIPIFGLLIGELILRLYGYGDPVLYQHDRQAHYLPSPNQHYKSLRGEVFINNFSMRREQDVTQTKPDNTFRILLVGDSTLYGGEYIKQDEHYAIRLEKQLNQQLPPGKSVEVLVAGVNSWGPFQQKGYLDKYGLFDADLLIMCIPIGNIYRWQFDLSHLPFSARKPISAWQMVALHLSFRFRHHMQIPKGWDTFENDDYRDMGINKYGELSDKVVAANIEHWYQIIPQGQLGLYGHDDPKKENEIELLRQELASRDVPVYFPKKLFVEIEDKTDLYHDPAHLGPKGHLHYAPYLEKQIRQHSPAFQQFAASN